MNPPSLLRRPLGAAVALALVLAACGGDDGSDTATAPTDGAPTSAAPASGVGAPTAAFPVTVEGDDGATTVEVRPERIVSLSPSLTEMLYAMGAGPQVLAVDASSDFPAGTPVTDLSGFRPNVEAIGALEPDLVVLSRDADGVAGALDRLGIAVVVLSSASSLADVDEQLRTLGAATGNPDAAAEVADGITEDVEELVASVPEGSTVRYFYELADDLTTVTSESFIGALLAEVGLESIADGIDGAAGAFPQLSNEAVVDADPELVLVAHTDGAELDVDALAARPGWSSLGAVQEGHVVALDPDVAARWGPRVVDLLASVIEASAPLR